MSQHAVLALCLLALGGCTTDETTTSNRSDRVRDSGLAEPAEEHDDDRQEDDDTSETSHQRPNDDEREPPSSDSGMDEDASADGRTTAQKKDGSTQSGSQDASTSNQRQDGSADRSDASTTGARSDAGPTSDVTVGDCTSLPATTDYAAKGPFADAKMFDKSGPTGGYLLYRPDASLGKDGFKHPLAVWGNGIATTADQYKQILTHVASHGFVVIACPDTRAERECLDKGMTWLVAQDTQEGPLKGKLDTSREVAIGYSWGGGAAIDTSDRPNMQATVSIQGMPPRITDAFTRMHAPLLLFTTTGDTFVSASGYVTPNYDKSTKVPTFYATLQQDVGHLYPLDPDAASAAAEPLLGGPLSGAMAQRAPTVAFLRHFACADEGARKYFFGASCELCGGEWRSRSKPMEAWN